MIASGTPREVAIQEQFRGKMSATADRSGAVEVKNLNDKPSAQDRAKSRLDKIRQAGRIIRKKTQRKSSEIVKSTADKLTKKDNKLKPKPAPFVKPKPDNKPTTNINVVLPKDKQPLGIEKIDSAEGGATATQKAAGNVAKLGFKGIKKLAGMRMRKEEFIQEVEDKKDSKAKKVIDIMKEKTRLR